MAGGGGVLGERRGRGGCLVLERVEGSECEHLGSVEREGVALGEGSGKGAVATGLGDGVRRGGAQSRGATWLAREARVRERSRGDPCRGSVGELADVTRRDRGGSADVGVQRGEEPRKNAAWRLRVGGDGRCAWLARAAGGRWAPVGARALAWLYRGRDAPPRGERRLTSESSRGRGGRAGIPGAKG